MDDRRFDDLTRKLANGTNRRILIRGLLGGTALGLAGRAAGAAPAKTTICHQTDVGFNVITVADSSLPDHYSHGDFAYTDCCTDDACPADTYCDAGTCTPLCVDADCLDDQACLNSVCTTLSCPPFLAPINHACQHPCDSFRGHCNDPDAGSGEHNCNCVSIASGEGFCHKDSTVFDGSLGACTYDIDCVNAGGLNTYTWRCLRNPEWDSGSCYGDVVFCDNWYQL